MIWNIQWNYPRNLKTQPVLISQIITKLQHIWLKQEGRWVRGHFMNVFLLRCWGEKVQLVGAQACVTDRGDRCRMMWCGQQVVLCHTERCPAQYVQHHRSQHHHCKHHHCKHHHHKHHHDVDNRWVSVSERHTVWALSSIMMMTTASQCNLLIIYP